MISMTTKHRDTVIVDAVRTPIGRAGKGSLVSVRPDDLAAHALRTLMDRVGTEAEIDLAEIIAGCGFPWGEQGYNVARTIALLARLARDTPGYTVTRLCASSLQALRSAHHAIAVGEGESYAIVGVESCSRAGRDRHLADNNPLLDPNMPGETIADIYLSMVETAENVATRYAVSRRDMDLYALQSQLRTARAIEDGRFDREIIPVPLPDGRLVASDDGPRPTTTLEILESLVPLMPDKGGRVTAGNACALNDGAIALMVTSARRAKELGLRPRARVVGSAVAAVDPAYMGVGPIDAVARVLSATGLSVGDLSHVEINEAFASQVIAVARAINLDPSDERLNPRGGAISLGHPFGMSGARLVSSALHGLEEDDGEVAMVTLCVGGGQGQAMVIERM